MIRVLFFASLREEVGASECALPAAPEGATLNLDGVMAALQARLGSKACTALAAQGVRIAINRELTEGAVQVRAGDELAFLPPVTGG